VIGGPIGHDTLSKTRLRCNRPLGRRASSQTMSGRTTVVAPENSADPDLLEPDQPTAYTSTMAEETCGVTEQSGTEPTLDESDTRNR